ncbi:hypothetical protein ILUMI_02342 [Ignelater luminosus]|uniref:DDE-1 domain-containing protein n=1 Tax=Ignelater luminosus TaxID=2038154 RepID=A0A8K0DIF0_IGNLU|nr:hypothetical protein ILUMI_02342 [Ignelater luminosus]
MGYKKAALTLNIPQSTLENRVKKVRQRGQFQHRQQKNLLGEERLLGLTLHDLRGLAFELAERNNLPNNFNNTTQITGKDYLYEFLNRYRNISLKDPEKTSIAQAKAFNRTAVSKFYDLLNSIYEKHNLSPNDIYNVGETGVLTVPNKQSKLLTLRGKKQVGCLSLAERGVLVTAEACMNAAGNFMPPMFVFPRKRKNSLLMDDAPPGSFAYYHESGWINAESFLYWFRRFIQYANPPPQKPVLLILNGHRSHSKSMALIDLAQHLFTPSETTERPQMAELLQAPKDLEPQPSTSSCGSSFSISPMMLMPPPQEEQRERQERKAPKRRLFNPTQDKKGSKAKIEKKKEKTANETITSKEDKKVMQESTSAEEDHEACMFCKELYSQSRAREGWIQCSMCRLWAHEAYMLPGFTPLSLMPKYEIEYIYYNITETMLRIVVIK